MWTKKGRRPTKKEIVEQAKKTPQTNVPPAGWRSYVVVWRIKGCAKIGCILIFLVMLILTCYTIYIR